jgi:hypothetical protein
MHLEGRWTSLVYERKEALSFLFFPCCVMSSFHSFVIPYDLCTLEINLHYCFTNYDAVKVI